MKGAKPRVCFVVATEITVTAFLLDQIRTAAKTHDVCVALNTRNNAFLAPYEINVEVVPVAIERKIKPLADLAALFALYRLFRARRFDLIHSVSPKAGLLAMLAGFLAGVPRRLHVFTGQVWVTRRGLSRFFLKSLDRLLAALATHLLADSPSQRDFLVAEGVVTATKCTVLGKGSISGVNTARFQPDAAARDMVRLELAVPADGVLFLYLGRLNRDKGIADLAAAFANLCRSRDDIWLALVGPDEENMATLARQLCGAHADHLRLVDYTNTPQRYMAAADVFCLPSYREGFGTVVIEAAACGVAAIASRIYGLTDAVIDTETGLLHAAGDVAAIETMMARLAGDRALRQRLGVAARNRACADFAMPVLTSALLAFYAKMLN
jgi:glycosyltransferase involved in cell wall biosynthesis